MRPKVLAKIKEHTADEAEVVLLRNLREVRRWLQDQT
jgi:hypothetical protein